MNQYLFTDIKLGIKHSFDVTIDEDKMQKFLDITEDTNPMHTDFSYAKSSGMKGKVVYGMLSSYTIGVPPKARSQYVTVKYALLGLMKALASEYASKRITINCLSPSMVNTKFLSDINERIIEFTAESHPLKRIAEVSDVIPSIMLLLSDDSNYINGINLPISGGLNF